MKTIFHIDMNSFFPSVEELLNPALKGKPVIVAANNRRSVVSSANYEARKYGIKSAMPLYRALLLCPKAKLVEPHFEYYEKYHNEFISLIKDKFTKEVEVASIDECYIDATKLVKKTSIMKVALSIQNAIKNKLGLNCSIGISNNKFLAKMASKFKKPLGITMLYKEDLPTKLWLLDVGEMHMIGKVSTKFLKENNINTIGELARLDNKTGYELFGNRWEAVRDNANGIGDDQVSTLIGTPKSISMDHTFLFDTNDYDQITKVIRTNSKEIWDSMIEQKLKTKTAILAVDDYKSYSKSKTIKGGINSYEMFVSILLSLYEDNFIDKPIRLVGVSLKCL